MDWAWGAKENYLKGTLSEIHNNNIYWIKIRLSLELLNVICPFFQYDTELLIDTMKRDRYHMKCSADIS
jgi:hypothetical protein